MESFLGTIREYLPRESVTVPLPDVLKTATASRGLRAEISYTVPLTVTYCACAPVVKPAVNRTTIKADSNPFLKPFI
jgi:hypothetical protein